MIARITKNWYARDERVPGMPEGCIDCFKERGLRCVESEAHLLFECVTTPHLHRKIEGALAADELQMATKGGPEHRLRVVVSSPHLHIWAVLGEVAHRIWCRPRQPWRRHMSRPSWQHTDTVI